MIRRALLLTVATTAVALTQSGGIPKHPNLLKFSELRYTPPKAKEFQHTLSNGAVAFLVEDHDFPLISVSVRIRTGEYLEPANLTGLAALTGSQIRSGGTLKRKPADFDEEVAYLAANLGSGISDTDGQAGLNCLSKDIDAGLALFVEMLREPGFDPQRLQLAKSQILQSLERRNDQGEEIEGREFSRLLYGDKHFSTREVTKASLEAITREDMMRFHQKYYYPSNFVLAVSGDFDTKTMLAKLEKAMAGWPNRTEAIPPVPKPEHALKPGIYMVDKDEVNQGRVRMGHLGTTLFNPDQIAISIMNAILGGGGFTSRIMSRVRSDEGLAYEAGSIFNPGIYYDGSFSVRFQSKSPTVAQAIAIVQEEIERMRAGNVTKEELETEVNVAIESFPRRFSTAGQRAGQFATDYVIHRPEDFWDRYRDRLRALTPDEIQHVARKYLQPDKLVILIVGDTKTIQKGNPDKPEFTLSKLAGGKPVTMIPLPDPLTMVYPAVGGK